MVFEVKSMGKVKTKDQYQNRLEQAIQPAKDWFN